MRTRQVVSDSVSMELMWARVGLSICMVTNEAALRDMGGGTGSVMQGLTQRQRRRSGVGWDRGFLSTTSNLFPEQG